MQIRPGINIGRYHIIEQLGEGGMAIVYKAYDTHLENEVAIKVIRTDNIPPKALNRTLKRFQIESKKMSQLTHQNIVSVLDYGEYNGNPYLVMRYLPGGTLKKFLNKPVSWQEAVRLLKPIAEALSYAHSKGLVHRDIKPSNILITESGDPILTDFGIAKILSSEETLDLTTTGIGVGTPEYMAPEQAEGKAIDERADVYSLGVVFYELVTGRKPFIADTPMAVIVKQMHDPLPDIRQFVKDLPIDIEHIIIKCLEKEPENRYTSMEELKFALQQSMDQKSVKVHEKSTLPVPGEGGVQKPKSVEKNVSKLRQKSKNGRKAPLKFAGVLIGLVIVFIFVFKVLNSMGLKEDSSNMAETNRIVSNSTPLYTIEPTPTEQNITVFNMEDYEEITSANFNNLEKIFDIEKIDNKSLDFLDTSDEENIIALYGENILSWDAKQGIEFETIFLDENSLGNVVVSVSSDQYIAIEADDRYEIFNLKDGSGIAEINKADGNVGRIGFSSDANYAVATNGERPGQVSLWDLQSSEVIKVLANSKNETIGVAISPDDQTIAADTDYNLIKLFDRESGNNTRILRGHSGWIRDLTFSPDGNLLASASSDGTIKIWNYREGKLLHTLQGHEFWVLGVKFSPDGSVIASKATDNTVKFWDTNTGELLMTIGPGLDNSSSIYNSDAIFSSDGKFIIIYTYNYDDVSLPQLWGIPK